MERKRPNNSTEIKTLKEKLFLYNDVLHTLRSGDVISDYLLTKQVSYGTKFHTEGVLKRMDEYHYNAEQKTQQLAAQIHSVNETVTGLKRDIDFIKDKMDRLQVHDLMEKMNHFMEEQSTSKNVEKSNEVDRLKQEINQLKQQMQTTQLPPQEQNSGSVEQGSNHKPKASEYRKLQNMLQSSRVSPARNDYYPPMSNQSSYQPYQQNHQSQPHAYQQTPPSFPKQTRAKVGKSKTYVNPQLDMNQQTTVRANSKKNDEKSAQIKQNDEKSVPREQNANPTNRQNTLQFQLMKPESIQMAKAQQNLQKVKEQENHKETKPIISEEPSINQVQLQREDQEKPTKKKESSIFSIFQKWNS